MMSLGDWFMTWNIVVACATSRKGDDHIYTAAEASKLAVCLYSPQSRCRPEGTKAMPSFKTSGTVNPVTQSYVREEQSPLCKLENKGDVLKNGLCHKHISFDL
jgi:hypothetical protein